MTKLTNQPVKDRAEHNAYFPSDYSLNVYTSPVTNFDGFKFENTYSGEKNKILMIATDERYLQMSNGKYFSTGNHPVETLLPMLHIDAAGFEIDIVTLSGNSVKLEMWAMPEKDENVMKLYNKYIEKFENPIKLDRILENITSENSSYSGVFIPGGHGAMINLPESREVKEVLKWAIKENKKIITLCHGAATLISGNIDESEFLFKNYKMTVFPDSIDEGANQEIGYMPGKLKWLLAEKLESLGAKIVNEAISGQVHIDRNLITGDSPLAANQLGIVAVDELLKMVNK